MDIRGELELLRTSLVCAELIQTELDRRVYHLKTLYDVSRDIFSTVECDQILRTFLMMTMGNFGVIEGFIVVVHGQTDEVVHWISIGFEESEAHQLGKQCCELLKHEYLKKLLDAPENLSVIGILPPDIGCALRFSVEPDCCGLLGLGCKLTDEPYNEDDRELLTTLLNNLVISLKNARAFEEIRKLNEDLKARNIELQDALNSLRAALRKVEILESVKTSLSKFVPTTVCKMIEKSPTGSILEGKEQDVSVLFADIEGYTKICEKLGGAALNELVERYFSVVMEAIYSNNGDINETAGDGLMVLFLNEDERTNALEAVQTAISIRERVASLQHEWKHLSDPLRINVGINSGRCLVGAVRFESYTGSRWTYTARGLVTNVAARLGSLATGGNVLLSKATADRVRGYFSPQSMGKFKLKNVSEEVEAFSV